MTLHVDTIISKLRISKYYQKFYTFVPKGLIGSMLALVRCVAWHRASDKPLCDPVLTQFTDTCTHWIYRSSGWLLWLSRWRRASTSPVTTRATTLPTIPFLRKHRSRPQCFHRIPYKLVIIDTIITCPRWDDSRHNLKFRLDLHIYVSDRHPRCVAKMAHEIWQNLGTIQVPNCHYCACRWCGT